jgi:hypothetical protein
MIFDAAPQLSPSCCPISVLHEFQSCFSHIVFSLLNQLTHRLNSFRRGAIESFPMAGQSECGPQGWAFNFQGEPYLDPIIDYTDPFALLEFDDVGGDDLWAGNQTPVLHGPISTGMDIFLGNDMWMQSLELDGINFCETNISNNMGRKSESHTNSSSSGLATPQTLPDSSVSPAQASCKPVPPLPRRPEKRTLEDCQMEFMGPKPATSEKRRRQPYEQQRRMEVGMIRQVGACIRCRLMKIPVRYACIPERIMDSFNTVRPRNAL